VVLKKAFPARPFRFIASQKTGPHALLTMGAYGMSIKQYSAEFVAGIMMDARIMVDLGSEMSRYCELP
jgi:hypothetical protein